MVNDTHTRRQGRSQDFRLGGGIALPLPLPTRGGALPLYQLGGLGERCKLPRRGPGRSPGRQRIFEHFGGSKTYLVAAISHLCYAVQLTKFTQISSEFNDLTCQEH